MHRDAPHAAAAAAHGQVQNMARQPRRPADRMARVSAAAIPALRDEGRLNWRRLV